MWLLQHTPPAPAPAPSGTSLPPSSSSSSLQDVWLHEGEWPLGRHESNRICVPSDKSISRKHALVSLAAPNQQQQQQQQLVVKVRDLGSTFGTWVNGERLEANVDTVLREGDTVRFGGVDTVFRCVVRRLRLCITRLNGENKRAVQQLAARIGAEVVKDWTSPAPTHLVAPDLTATTKVLVAICTNTPIVTPDWLVAILSRRRATDPVPNESEFVPLAQSRMEPLTTSRASLFRHTDFVLTKHNAEYEALIKAAGGMLYVTVPARTELEQYDWWNRLLLRMRDPQNRVLWLMDKPNEAIDALLQPYLESGQLRKVSTSEIAAAVFACRSLHDPPAEPLSLVPSTQPTQATQATLASQNFEPPQTQPPTKPSSTAQSRTSIRTRTLIDSQQGSNDEQAPSSANQVERKPHAPKPSSTPAPSIAVPAPVPAPVVAPAPTLAPSHAHTPLPAPIPRSAQNGESIATASRHDGAEGRRSDKLAKNKQATALSPPPTTPSLAPQEPINVHEAPRSKASARGTATSALSPPADSTSNEDLEQRKRPRDESVKSPTRKRPTLVSAMIPARAQAARAAGRETQPIEAAHSLPEENKPLAVLRQQPTTRRLTPPSTSWAVKPRDRARQTPTSDLVKVETQASHQSNNDEVENIEPLATELEEEGDHVPPHSAVTEDRDDLIVRRPQAQHMSPVDRGGSAILVVDFKRFKKNFVVGRDVQLDEQAQIPRSQLTAVAPQESERQVQLRLQEQEAARHREEADALFSTRLAAKAKKARK